MNDQDSPQNGPDFNKRLENRLSSPPIRHPDTCPERSPPEGGRGEGCFWSGSGLSPLCSDADQKRIGKTEDGEQSQLVIPRCLNRDLRD